MSIWKMSGYRTPKEFQNMIELTKEDQFSEVFMTPDERYKREFAALCMTIDSTYTVEKLTKQKSFILHWTMENGESGVLNEKIHVGILDQRCNPRGPIDFAIVTQRTKKEIVHGMTFHERCDMDFAGYTYNMDFLMKCLTSTVLHCPAGLFGFWDYAVRRIAREMDMLNVFRVID